MNREDSASKNEEFFPSSQKVYVSGKLYDDVQVPFREITLSPTHTADGSVEANESLRVYDTSGPWGDGGQSCDSESGLRLLRGDWIRGRDDVEEI